ncbi:uncharacterized protein LOC114533422 [Dendronephthya gigantea]|uniref:uncharacterized protein LOC114533422 n=1 Tax=Dendronephthya gigantea TaxID=151771 RepID=UPI00106C4019|nr:uncharacterized protein LOC114533422 [Dendronephthya gigantea]
MDPSKYFQKGIEISSTSDISLLCSQGYYLSGDGYLALPTKALGSEYIVSSYDLYFYQPWSPNRANVAVISAHDDNRVIVIPDKNALIYYRGLWYNGRNSQLYIIHVLNKLEALYITEKSDLSGTLVIASKQVSVISGVDTPLNLGGAAFLGASLHPISSWGYEYVLTTVRSMDKNRGDIFRIFAYRYNTVVTTAYWIKTLSPGTYTELILEKDLASYVNCSEPCQVVQYIRGESVGRRYADSSMVVVPSVNQFLSFYHVVIPGGLSYHDSITIFIEKEDINGLFFNGVKLNHCRWDKINGTNYVWTVISLSGPNTVKVYHSSEAVKFGLLAFGWNSEEYSAGRSYAFSGGFALNNKSAGKVHCTKNIMR